MTAPRARIRRPAAALALALAAGPVRADDAAASAPAPAAGARPAADAKQTAERYFRAGAKAYAAQSFAAAAANFDEAYAALPLPEIAFSAAQAYRRLYRVDPKPSHVQRAVELYRVYLDKVKTGGRVGDAADSLGEMERELDKLKARGARIETAAAERTRLGINISLGGQAPEAGAALREIGDATGDALPGVKVAIDGKPVEPFALVDVVPGEHAISAAADGYFPVEKRQRALAGATALVEVELRPRPAQVAIRTEAGARIAVDGRAMPSPRLELAPGKHLIAVTRPGREPFAREITVGRGEALVLTAPLAKTGRRRAAPWVLAGAGGLGVIAALSVTTALVEDNRAQDLRAKIRAGDQPASAGDAYDGAIRRRDAATTTAWVFGVGALVVGATAAALYLIETPAEVAPAEPVAPIRRSASAAGRARRLMLAPVASSTGGGIAAVGRF